MQNTGKRDGDEVVQVYVRALTSVPVKLPRRQLAGFQRVPLRSGEGRPLSFAIDPRDLAYWDAASKAWVLDVGTYAVMVGSSSADIRLRSQFQIATRGQWSDSSPGSSDLPRN